MNRYTRVRGGPVIAIVAILAMAAGATADVALHDGLISSWSFDDGSASMIVDDPVGGNDATLDAGMGAGNWVSGILGGAISFNGISDGAVVPNTPSLSPTTTALTIAAWVKLDKLPADISESFGGIYDSYTDAYVLYLDKGNKELRCKITTTDAGGTGTGAARPGVPTALLDTTSWHHVAGVFDGACVRMYYDGRLVDMQGITGAGGYVLKGQDAAFGMQTDPAGVAAPINHFPGKIDDAAVWSRALSGNEIAYLYNGGAGNAVMAANPVIAPNPPSPNPVLRYRFSGNLVNEGTGGAAYDGQLVDGPNGDMIYVAGPLGQAADLTQATNNPAVGTGAYIRVPYTMPEKGTLTFWAKPKSFYNYNSLLDNSVNQDQWEMWVYADGRARFRIASDSYVEYDLDNLGLGGADKWYHFAVTWYRAEATNLVGLSMFINGQHVAGDDGAWIVPGSTIGIGGGLLNSAGQVTLDDFRIYDCVLSTQEILDVYNVPEPAAVALLLSALALAPLWRRRK